MTDKAPDQGKQSEELRESGFEKKGGHPAPDIQLQDIPRAPAGPGPGQPSEPKKD